WIQHAVPHAVEDETGELERERCPDPRTDIGGSHDAIGVQRATRARPGLAGKTFYPRRPFMSQFCESHVRDILAARPGPSMITVAAIASRVAQAASAVP